MIKEVALFIKGRYRLGNDIFQLISNLLFKATILLNVNFF